MAPTFNHVCETYVPKELATKLHTVDVWHRDEEIPEGSIWVIFIHGGGWRDPDNTSLDFVPALELLSSSQTRHKIAGFASINYRLSAYPTHPLNPSSPDDPSRNAIHNDHVYDVSRALAFLEKEYDINTGYLLVGHSAGATIAFQIQAEQEHFLTPTPAGILGVEGIYDLEQLVKSFEHVPFYRELIANAFGNDTYLWKDASPTTTWKPALWTYCGLVLIAHSDEDELVDKRQADLMLGCARKVARLEEKVHFMKATGSHDDIIGKGHELMRLVEEALTVLKVS
jgi:kynurenine formamidase